MNVYTTYLLSLILCWISVPSLLFVIKDETGNGFTEVTKGQMVLWAGASLIPFFNTLMAVLSVSAVGIAITVYIGAWLNKNAPHLVKWWDEPVKEKNDGHR